MRASHLVLTILLSSALLCFVTPGCGGGGGGGGSGGSGSFVLLDVETGQYDSVALNEIVEFVATLLVPDTNVGGYRNTGWDLVANLVGATLAVLAIALLDRGADPSNPERDS